MKKWSFAFGGIFVVLLFFFLFQEKQANMQSPPNSAHLQTKNSLPTEQFLLHYLWREDMMWTNFSNKENGNLSLSESMGLWMEYVLDKQDITLFHEAFLTVHKQFLLKEGIVAWKIEADEVAHTNALIDDLRIVEALFVAGERYDYEPYTDTAVTISNALMEYNQQAEGFVDFYDTKHEEANDTLTISYVNLDAMEWMERYGILPKSELEKMNSFMRTLPIENGFYPQSYDVIQNTFSFDKEINLIDQLYIGLHLERANIETDELYEWLKSEFYEEMMLYGRYDCETKHPTVDYEAAAVYGLAILYSMERQDDTFSEDLYEQMKTLQVQDETSPYNGGYFEVAEHSTHSFDNLFPLLAERRLQNENIIQ